MAFNTSDHCSPTVRAGRWLAMGWKLSTNTVLDCLVLFVWHTRTVGIRHSGLPFNQPT